MCAHTSLLINFWVNDMTTRANETHSGAAAGKPLPPNINMNFIGKDSKTGKDVVLHRFTSGDALTHYTKKDPYDVPAKDTYDEIDHSYETNEYIGKWQQLAYSFSLSENLSNYKEFYLEVQNNTIHSQGADYAIDGLTVYRTKPQIDVKRIDACSSNNLTVSTDYGLLLRNMGWNLQPDVLAGLNMGEKITEGSKHLWKYRYGLLGDDAANIEQYNYVGNIYFGFAKDMQNSVSSERDAWVTLNRDLLEYDNVSYNNRSKLYRIVVPTTEEARLNRFNDIINPDKAKALQIEWNLRMINNFYHDAKTTDIWDEEIKAHALQRSAGEGFSSKEEYLKYLEEGLGKHSSSYENYKITIDSNKVKEIMDGVNGLDESYEKLVRAVCSVLGMTRLRVPWWEQDNGTLTGKIDLSVIDVNKTDLKYKGERNFATEAAAASGEYDVVIFSARTTTDTSEKIEFPNASVDFKDPCVLSSPFTVLPSFTVVAQTKSAMPGTIACEGRISAIDEATVWVRQIDEANNLLDDQKEFTEQFTDNTYTFDWFLGTMEEYNAFNTSHNTNLADLLKNFRKSLGAAKQYKHFEGSELIDYCKRNESYNNEALIEGLEKLLGLDNNVDTEPKLIIGDVKGKAEFRWVEWVVMLPFLPENILEDSTVNREWLFCDQPQERRLEAAPAPTLLAGFADVTYPEK